MFKNEFVIWGKAPNKSEETLLLSKFNNKHITSKSLAESLIKVLAGKGCTEMRIQEIDFSKSAMDEFVNDLAKGIRLKNLAF